MLTEGTIHLARKIQEHWVWQDDIRRNMWLHFLLNARPSSDPKQVCGPWIVGRRQLVRSATDLAQTFDTNRSKVRREINGMVTRKVISIQTKRGRSGHYSGHLITVLKFDEYNTYGACLMTERPFSEPSSTTTPASNARAQEVEGAAQLREYLGEHAWVVDALAAQLTTQWWARAILTWYGPRGSRHSQFAGLPMDQRPAVLAGGLAAYLEATSEAKREDIHQRTLGSCIVGSTQEALRAVNATLYTAEAEESRVRSQRAAQRSSNGLQRMGEDAPEPELKLHPREVWFKAQPEAIQKALWKSAKTLAEKNRDRYQTDKTSPVKDLAVQICLAEIIQESMDRTPIPTEKTDA